ncbi:MAG: phenylpyruvate tautomerase MIF-related protein [Verrucomicrobiota bacterium]
MPLLTISTTQPVSDDQLVEAAGMVANVLGKPKSIMMGRALQTAAMSFGEATSHIALFEIEGIELSSDPTEELTSKLCDFAERELEVPAQLVFVKLTNVPRGNWGGNNKVY